jgi:glutathione S-transferase
MIDFYGSPMSSAGRTHVMLEETGAPYRYHRVNNRAPAERAAYLAINPAGKVPFLVDGELRLPESIAINFYLAERYAPQLWADTPEGRARLMAWSLWAVTNLQPETLRVLHHTMFFTEDKRSPHEVEAGKKGSQRYLDELEAALPATGWLVGDRYTVADLNVASCVNLTSALGAGTLGPRTAAWLAANKARPAWQRAAAEG